MSERTEVSFDAALMMALRADAQKELDELPTPAQLKGLYPDTSRWDARLKAALHKRRPVLKRVLVAALTLGYPAEDPKPHKRKGGRYTMV